MSDSGYVNLWNIECSYIEKNGTLVVIPCDKRLKFDFADHYNNKNFKIVCKDNDYFYNVYYIENIIAFDRNELILNPKFAFKQCLCDEFNEIEIIGDSIDHFFNPARYFYNTENKETINLTYERIIANSWNINIKNTSILIELSYGNILNNGINSDLKLHPRLNIKFSNTKEIEYVFNIYLAIRKFMKIIRYCKNDGDYKVGLISNINNKRSYSGYLFDYSNKENKFEFDGNFVVNYTNYENYIERFFSFVFNDTEYSIEHYPQSVLRNISHKFSEFEFEKIYSSFEYECNNGVFSKADVSKISSIKGKILNNIKCLINDGLSTEEKKFLNDAIDSINRLGTSLSQLKKLEISYDVQKDIFDNSMSSIFTGELLYENNGFNIGNVLKKINKLRSEIVHGSPNTFLTNDDMKCVFFLEILTYSLFLKRINFANNEIEKIIGALFSCNNILFNEMINKKA